MEKIKIIDILQRIENRKDVPYKIIFEENEYIYQGDDYLYLDEDRHEHWLFSTSYTDKGLWLYDFLKEEVEIIEEDKKIEKIKELEEPLFDKGRFYIRGIDGCMHEINPIERIFRLKINEIIDYITKENK